MSANFTNGYAGDLKPGETYERLTHNPDGLLIDVRTVAEWHYVGLPAFDRMITVAWQHFPDMRVNEDFVKEVEMLGASREQEIFLICRSGIRSAAAARALTSAGFATCYNVAEGFEGDLDNDGHRGMIGGWKRAGLPWRQG